MPSDFKRPLILRIRDAAAAMQMSENHIRNLVARGDLEGFKLHNGVSHVSTASIRHYLKQHRTPETRDPQPISFGQQLVTDGAA